MVRNLRRSTFLAGLAVAPLAFAPLPARSDVPRYGRALVLAGGGARGAYEAGVIEGMRAAAGTPDGSPIPGIDVVCGTSIGALNGWFLATAQYSKLSALWHGIASQPVFQVKRKFAAILRPDAFVLTKIVEALALAQGLTTDVQGVLDGGTLARWIDGHIDPRIPVITPFCFTVTNLDKARAELFLRLPFSPNDEQLSTGIDRLRHTVGMEAAVRLCPDDLLDRALQASATLPVLLDPIVMVSPEGDLDHYVDGGIADNDPIDVARALALDVDSVLVDPAESGRSAFNNALAIGVGAFGVAQARIIAASLRATYLETQGKRLFQGVATTAEQRAFLDRILDVGLSILRPTAALPVASRGVRSARKNRCRLPTRCR